MKITLFDMSIFDLKAMKPRSMRRQKETHEFDGPLLVPVESRFTQTSEDGNEKPVVIKNLLPIFQDGDVLRILFGGTLSVQMETEFRSNIGTVKLKGGFPAEENPIPDGINLMHMFDKNELEGYGMCHIIVAEGVTVRVMVAAHFVLLEGNFLKVSMAKDEIVIEPGLMPN